MAIQSGIGEALYVNQYDMSGDIGAFSSIKASRNLQDTTTIQQAAMARTRLLRDGEIGYNAFFDVAAGGSHPVFSALPGANALFTWASGLTLGATCASLQAIQADYPLTRGQDGSVVVNPVAQGNAYGLEWGELLTTGKQTFASAASGTAIDYGAVSTLFGLAGYLHAISLGSGTATVAIQDSADNISFANVTGAVFTAVAGATSERIQTAVNATVRRYVRINVTGTFTNLVCAVSFVRYLADPTI